MTLSNATEKELAEAEALCPAFSLARNSSAFGELLKKMSSGKLLQWMAAGTELINMSLVPDRFAICDVHQGGVAIPEYVLAAILQWNAARLQLWAFMRPFRPLRFASWRWTATFEAAPGERTW